jgi:hypothetical protein
MIPPPKRHEISNWRGWRFESSVCSVAMPSQYHTQTECTVKCQGLKEGTTQKPTDSQASKCIPYTKIVLVITKLHTTSPIK